jgi:hypothetical protein
MKTIKLKKKYWAVVWKNDGGVGAISGNIISVEPFDDFTKDCYRDTYGISISSLAIFAKKVDAEVFRDNNSDWEIRQIKLENLK